MTQHARRTTRDSAESVFLDAAERLFAKRGFDGTSVRAIAEASGVNLGALHYYWGSKDELYRAVCERRLRPIVRERLRRFDRCIAEAPAGKPSLRQVVEAGFMPIDSSAGTGEECVFGALGELLARLATDPSPAVRSVVDDILKQASGVYVKLLRQCCPHLDDEAFYWRMHGVFGTARDAYSGNERIVELSGRKFLGTDTDAGSRELIEFIVAGLLAPSVERHRTRARKRAARRSQKAR